MITQKEWNERIKKLWGTSFVLLELSDLSLDENISRARILQTGNDPHIQKRKSKAQELAEILSHPGRENWIREGDEPYLELLNSGLINYPPQDRIDLVELINPSSSPKPHPLEGL